MATLPGGYGLRPCVLCQSQKLFPVNLSASRHLPGKVARVLALAKCLHGFVKVVVELAVGGGFRRKVGAQLVGGAVRVHILADDGLLGKAGGLGAALLLLRGAAKHQHTGGHNVLRQVQGVAHGLSILEDIAYVAAADAQRLGGDHGVLGGNAGVGHGQHQVPCPGLAGVRDARGVVGVEPAAAVGQEHQHQRCPGNERLVVAQVGQRGLQRRVGDVQDRVQLLVARRRCLERRVQDGRPLVRRDGVSGEYPHAFAGGEGGEDSVVFHNKLL